MTNTTLPRPLSGAETVPMPPDYLGRLATHPKHGEGVVVFVEDSSSEAWRLLLIAFAEHTEEVIPERMAEHGYELLSERVSLPAAYRRLPGHDQITGWAIGLREAREGLGVAC